jgi:Fe-S-cluster containining protein
VTDGAFRRSLKRLVRVCFRFDLVVARTVLRMRGREPFVLGGDCRSCGACCESPSLKLGWALWYLPTLRRAVLAWQRHVNGFVLASLDFRSRTLAFRCTHFDRETRRCDSYDSRPGMCRDYPRLLLYQPHPELLPECGHRPIRKDRKRMLRVLDSQPMSAAQRARLAKDLFLDE